MVPRVDLFFLETDFFKVLQTLFSTKKKGKKNELQVVLK